MKDLIQKQEEELNRFLSWSEFGINVEEREELKRIVGKVRKETAEKVCDKMIGKDKLIDNPECPYAVIGYNERILEEKELKSNILKEL